MKLFILAALMMTTLLSAEELKEESSSIQLSFQNWREEKESLKQTDISYEEGQYDDFLKSLHDQYIKEKKEGGFEQILANMRLNSQDYFLNQQKIERMRAEENRLSSQRDEQLKELTKNHSDLIIGQIIKEATGSLKQQEIEAFTYLKELEEGLIKNENDLLVETANKILTEYHVKHQMLLRSFVLDGIDENLIRVQKRVLRKEKIEKLMELSEKYPESLTAKKIKLAAQASSALRTYGHAWRYLTALEKGKIAPANSIEEQVKDILIEYRKKELKLKELEIS